MCRLELRGKPSDKLQCESKKSPCGFQTFFPKWLGIFNKFLHTHYAFLYARLQIFIHLSPTLTQLCHTKRGHPSNFYISLELNEPCHIQHVCWHYNSSRSGMTCHRRRSTKLSKTFANV